MPACLYLEIAALTAAFGSCHTRKYSAPVISCCFCARYKAASVRPYPYVSLLSLHSLNLTPALLSRAYLCSTTAFTSPPPLKHEALNTAPSLAVSDSMELLTSHGPTISHTAIFALIASYHPATPCSPPVPASLCSKITRNSEHHRDAAGGNCVA